MWTVLTTTWKSATEEKSTTLTIARHLAINLQGGALGAIASHRLSPLESLSRQIEGLD
jgi:hypothetical protein